MRPRPPRSEVAACQLHVGLMRAEISRLSGYAAEAHALHASTEHGAFDRKRVALVRLHVAWIGLGPTFVRLEATSRNAVVLGWLLDDLAASFAVALEHCVVTTWQLHRATHLIEEMAAQLLALEVDVVAPEYGGVHG